MKNLLIIFVYFLIASCSFDNKTGIWKDASSIPVENQDGTSIDETNSENRYEDVLTKSKLFNEEVESKKNSVLKLDLAISMENWTEQYANLTNNVSNFSYEGDRRLISKSSKLSKLNLNNDNFIFICSISFSISVISCVVVFEPVKFWLLNDL